jgi:hypothetical protein
VRINYSCHWWDLLILQQPRNLTVKIMQSHEVPE